MRKLALLLVTLTGTAAATPVTVTYSGTVDRMTYADCTALNPSNSCTAWTFTAVSTSDFANGKTIAQGDAFSGSFTYDPSTPLGPFGISSDGHQASYLRAVTSAPLTIGAAVLPSSALPIAVSGGSVAVVDGRNGWDGFALLQSYSGPTFFANTGLFLWDTSGALFSGFAVPTAVAPALIDQTNFNVGFLRRSDGDQLQVWGNVIAFSFSSAVPEPSTTTLLVAGVALLWAGRRRRGVRNFAETPLASQITNTRETGYLKTKRGAGGGIPLSMHNAKMRWAPRTRGGCTDLCIAPPGTRGIPEFGDGSGNASGWGTRPHFPASEANDGDCTAFPTRCCTARGKASAAFWHAYTAANPASNR